MKKTITLMLAGIFAMGAVMTITTTDAEARRWRKRRGGCMKMLMRAPSERLKQKLGMSDAQITSLKKLKADFVQAAIPLKAKIQLQRFAIRQLMDNQTIDQAKVLAAVGQMNTLRGQMRLLKVKKKLQLRALIQPQQRQKIRKICRRMKRARWGRRGHRWGRRGKMGRRGHRWGGRGMRGHHRGGKRGWHGGMGGPNSQPAPNAPQAPIK